MERKNIQVGTALRAVRKYGTFRRNVPTWVVVFALTGGGDEEDAS
jgi:hypothetical protein